MIENNLNIIVNQKSDIESLERILKKLNVQAPIIVLEFENSFKINFTSEYEHWELENEIIKEFPNYEFTENIGNGNMEIRLQLFRRQSESSRDVWGRPLEYLINETKYLIEKSVTMKVRFNPTVKVFFENEDQFYYVNITRGIIKSNDQKGYLVLNEFREKNIKNNCDHDKRLFETPLEAFYAGVRKIEQLADEDFKAYLTQKKRNIRKKNKK